jgi:DNA-3-methyladenine glycosylase
VAAEPRLPALTPLRREFFERDTETVAKELLGVWLLRSSEDGLTGGPIVEVEAYGGPEDKASHSRAGRTKRTEPMFGQVGHAYVYLVYGMHDCLNVVAYKGKESGAVLLRAIEPRIGADLMRTRRGRATVRVEALASGPARLCQAMAVNRSFDGHDLTIGTDLWLAVPDERVPNVDIQSGPRIGVDYAGPGWAERPWRFSVRGSSSVSKPR